VRTHSCTSIVLCEALAVSVLATLLIVAVLLTAAPSGRPPGVVPSAPAPPLVVA
jgi:hypothetical protein